MMRTTAIVAALALFARPITADDQTLCSVDSDWDGDAVVEGNCFYAYSATAELVEDDCPDELGFTFYDNMYCYKFGLTETECYALGAVYYDETTCSGKEDDGEWYYDGDIDPDTCFDDDGSLFKVGAWGGSSCWRVWVCGFHEVPFWGWGGVRYGVVMGWGMIHARAA